MRTLGTLFAIILLALPSHAQEEPKPKLYMVAIAIDEYGEGFPQREKVLVKYARELATKLAKKQKKGVFGQAEVKLLANKEATAQRIFETLAAVTEKAGPEDVFILYFAGCIVPVDDSPEPGDGAPPPEDGEPMSDEEIAEREEAARLAAEQAEADARANPDGGAAGSGNLNYRFVPFDGKVDNADTWIPYWALQDMLTGVACHSQFVVLDGFIPAEDGIGRMLEAILNLDPEMMELLEIRRTVIWPSDQALQIEEAERLRPGLVTRAVTACLSPAGDLDEDGVVSAREIEASMPAAVYKLLAADGHAELSKQLFPNSEVLGPNFPLHAVGVVKQGATSTRGMTPIKTRSEKAKEKRENAPRADRAVLFATNVYKHKGWKPLANPIADARDLKKTLEQEYGFEVELVENPTRTTMFKVFEKYKKIDYNPKDQLLFFFAGHGVYDKLMNVGYVICADSTYGTRPDVAMTHGTLSKYLDALSCQHVLLLLDVCFSGTFRDPATRAVSRGADLYAELDREAYVKRRLQYKSRLYLTSGDKEEVPDGDVGKNSPFMNSVLEGLRGASVDAKRKLVTFDALREKVAALKGTSPQGGKFGRHKAGGTFILVRTGK